MVVVLVPRQTRSNPAPSNGQSPDWDHFWNRRQRGRCTDELFGRRDRSTPSTFESRLDSSAGEHSHTDSLAGTGRRNLCFERTIGRTCPRRTAFASLRVRRALRTLMHGSKRPRHCLLFGLAQPSHAEVTTPTPNGRRLTRGGRSIPSPLDHESKPAARPPSGGAGG